jgi:hypothetical protein
MISKAPIEPGRDPPVVEARRTRPPRSRRTLLPPRLTSASRVTLRSRPSRPRWRSASAHRSPLRGTGTATHHAVAVDLVVVTAVRSILRPTQAA